MNDVDAIEKAVTELERLPVTQLTLPRSRMFRDDLGRVCPVTFLQDAMARPGDLYGFTPFDEFLQFCHTSMWELVNLYDSATGREKGRMRVVARIREWLATP